MLALVPKSGGWNSEEDLRKREASDLKKQNRRFRSYNRRRLLDFLAFYQDFHELGYVSPSGAYGDDMLTMGGDELLAGAPLSPLLVRIMEDPNAFWSHKVCHNAVDDLRRRKWPLYMRLGPAYFFEENNPDLPDVWALEASVSLGDKMARDDHITAVAHLMNYVETFLPRGERFVEDESGPSSVWRPTGEPLRKLKIIVPLRERRGLRVEKKIRRRNALESYHSHRQDCDDAEAVRRAAEETGYSAKEIRKIRGEEEQGRRL